MKVGTKTKPLKVRGHATFDCLDNAKMKRSKKATGVNSKSKTGKNCDQEKGKTQKHIDDDTVRPPPRTTSHQVTCSNNKCNVLISLLMSFTSNDWYLSSKGCLDHILHVQKYAIYENITTNDLDESEKLMNIIFQGDMSLSVIGRTMDSFRSQKGKCGRLRSRSVYHAAQRHRDAMDLARGISKDWTIAQRTLRRLEVLGVSYYALMMDKNDT